MFEIGKSAETKAVTPNSDALRGKITIVDGGRVSVEKAMIIEINRDSAVITTQSELSSDLTLILTIMDANRELVKLLSSLDSDVEGAVDMDVQVTVIKSQPQGDNSGAWLTHLQLSRSYRLNNQSA